VGLLLAAAGDAALAEPPAEGTSVPDFTLPVLDGGSATLSGQAGEGPVVLVFFRGAW
jgi:peroxiredoxin